MRIKDIQVDGFGVWKGLTVEPLSDELTVFFGQNEAGKTTLMQFIRTNMFGFSAERLDRYVPPVYGGLAGGSIEVACPGGAFEVQRHIDPNRMSDPAGDLAVTNTADGVVHGANQLSQILSDIDESIFNNVFAIGLREIQELGALNSTEASDMLYKLTSGLDRVSLVDVMRELRGRREKLLTTESGQVARLDSLVVRRQELIREIDELRAMSRRWARIAAQSNDVAVELDGWAGKLTTWERELRLIELAMQVSERWQKRHVLAEQIDSFGKLPDPRDIAINDLEKLNERIAAGRDRIEQIKQQRKKIKKEALSLPINRRLYSQKARIDALNEHSPWIESLQRQSERLRTEVDLIENSLVGEVDGLGSQLQIKTKDVLDLGNRGLNALKSSAKKLLDQRDRLKRMESEAEKFEFDLGQHRERLGSASSRSDAPVSLDEATRYVNRLRRRIELEQKIDKLNQSRHQLESEIDEIVNEQVLPVGKLSVIGVVFVLGTVLVGFGLIDAIFGGSYFGQATGNLGFLMMLMGAVCGFVAMGLKFHWERVARDELDDFRHQMEVIRQQLKRAKTEREEIERQLPDSIVDYQLELTDAEAHLARMEGLVPLENRVHSAESHVEDVRRRIKKQQAEVDSADQNWRADLRSAGLPEVLEPLQLKEIMQRTGRISDRHARLDSLRTELAEREKEISSLQNRVDALLNDCGVEVDGGDILQRLNQLMALMHEQRDLVNTRKELATRYRQLRSRLHKCKQEIDRWMGQKSRLLANVGADNEQEFRQFELKHAQRTELQLQHDSLTEQISAALGSHFSENDVSGCLQMYGHGGLERQWEEVQGQIENGREEQTRLHQQQGEFQQELKTLGEDTRLDEARLELNVVDAQIKGCQEEWQVLATSCQMLESIRDRYESKRQPETLREASGYLEQLTEGQYTRIWTRMIGEELLCDNADDETITVDKLSRGTREAVYLSLRLALIGAYARRGAVLPMVLDDVLVNFDSQRARAAAKLLCEFSAKGYQILMFTCHEHMAELFHSLDAQVKRLPHHRDVFENNAVPIDFRPVVGQKPPQSEPVAPVPGMATAPIERSPLVLDTTDYDPELQYELSAVADDQQAGRQLREELVYLSPELGRPIDLSADHEIWRRDRASA